MLDRKIRWKMACERIIFFKPGETELTRTPCTPSSALKRHPDSHAFLTADSAWALSAYRNAVARDRNATLSASVMPRCGSVPATAGPRRDFDINIDGMVHYGMLPDLLQDVRNVGLDKEDLAPLFRGANDYIEMWEMCERQAEKITAKAEKKTE